MQERGDVDQERNRRYDEEDVRDEIDDVVDHAADVGGEDAERRGEDRGDQAGSGTEEKRAPRAPCHLCEDVGALVARAEHVVERRSLARVEVLLSNMRARFSGFPAALAALHGWQHMLPETRRVLRGRIGIRSI